MLSAEEVCAMQEAHTASDQQWQEQMQEAVAQQAENIRARRETYQIYPKDKVYTTPNTYKCPTCYYPNFYERDACNKLSCGNCEKMFCVVCLQPALQACSHLYSAY